MKLENESLASLETRLESAAGQVSHSGTTGGARVQLQLVQELEAVLTSNEIKAAEFKAASHGIMSSLLRMLENGLPGPVRCCLKLGRISCYCALSLTTIFIQIRASVLRCLQVIFSLDPIRATLAHGQVSEFLQAQAKAYTQAGSTAVVGLLEVLALHAYMCASTHPILAWVADESAFCSPQLSQHWTATNGAHLPVSEYSLASFN
jgi:hypothetical protein